MRPPAATVRPGAGGSYDGRHTAYNPRMPQQEIEEVRRRRVEARTARLFSQAADNMGRSSAGGIVIPMSLLRQELADLTGTRLKRAFA